MKSDKVVDFRPSGRGTVALIRHFNEMIANLSPEETATMFASHVAAIAYLMSENNTPLVIQSLFATIAADAYKQFTRQKERAEAVIRLPDNEA